MDRKRGALREDGGDFLSLETQAKFEILPDSLSVSQIARLHPMEDDFAKVLINAYVKERLDAEVDDAALQHLLDKLAPGIPFDLSTPAVYAPNGVWIIVRREHLRDYLEDVGNWPLHPDIPLSHWWPGASCRESDAISWPQCLAMLEERLGTCAEEVSFWVANNGIHAYSLRSCRGFYAVEIVSNLDEPNLSPVYNLLDRYKYNRVEVENFDPVQDANPGPVARLSDIDRTPNWTPYYNPSGRFLSFDRVVKFLTAIPERGPKSKGEIASAISAWMAEKEIAPRHPFGIGASDKTRIVDAWFPEGTILMLAMEHWGMEFHGWDAASVAEVVDTASDLSLGRAERGKRKDFAQINESLTIERVPEWERWKAEATRIQEARTRKTSKRELARLVRKNLGLPDSTETIRKRL